MTNDNVPANARIQGLDNLDALFSRVLSVSPKLAAHFASGKPGRKYDTINGTKAYLERSEAGDTLELAVFQFKNYRISCTYYTNALPTVRLVYYGEDGALLTELAGHNGKTLGEALDIRYLREIFMPFVDLELIYSDFQPGPTWDAWHTLVYHLKGDALGRNGKFQPVKAAENPFNPVCAKKCMQPTEEEIEIAA